MPPGPGVLLRILELVVPGGHNSLLPTSLGVPHPADASSGDGNGGNIETHPNGSLEDHIAKEVKKKNQSGSKFRKKKSLRPLKISPLF